MSYSLTRFAIYETVRDMMGSSSEGPMPFYQKVLLGAFGGKNWAFINLLTLLCSFNPTIPCTCIWMTLKQTFPHFSRIHGGFHRDSSRHGKRPVSFADAHRFWFGFVWLIRVSFVSAGCRMMWNSLQSSGESECVQTSQSLRFTPWWSDLSCMCLTAINTHWTDSTGSGARVRTFCPFVIVCLFVFD